MPKRDTAALRVLMAASEVVPFAKTGGLGDVAGTLPFALLEEGVMAAVVMPHYASIPEKLLENVSFVAEFDVPTAKGLIPCALSKTEYKGLTVFLVGNEGYFFRDAGLYGYEDDLERFAFFSRAICEAMIKVPDFSWDVIHCNDWQTAMVPVYLNTHYARKRACAKVKTVFTVHNAAFQGQKWEDSLEGVLDLADYPLAGSACTLDDGSVNMMKGALSYGDYVTTVSPTYASELQTREYGEYLDPVFRRRRRSLDGILNGIDLDGWNPATDEYVVATYDCQNMDGKATCKQALQQEFGLEQNPDRPLVAIVSRLTEQKGIHMVILAMERLMDRGVQVAILGTGDAWMEEQLSILSNNHPGQLGVAIRFDNGLSHRVYAGADILLMPSLFEPCGLSQMIAMRYGTLPVVRETGGLKDSVEPYNMYTGQGTGFSFANANADEMADILLNACEVFWTDKAAWAQLKMQAMTADFSWKRAATNYVNIYQGLK